MKLPMNSHMQLVLAAFSTGIAVGVLLLQIYRRVLNAAGENSACGGVDQERSADGIKPHCGATPQVPGMAVLFCSMCQQYQPQTAFASKQARRPDSSRKCRLCVESSKASDHPTPQPPLPPPPLPSPHAATESATASEVDSIADPLRLVRKAETVLRGRSERVLLILENCMDDLNHVAVLRTCDALGVLRVWLVESGVPPKNPQAQRTQQRKAAQRGVDCDPLLGFRRAQLYAAHLDIRTFNTTVAAVAAARADGRQLWVTDLAQGAWALPADPAELAVHLPRRLAIVLGSESAGVSYEMLCAADRRVFLPMYGFVESFNLSVASALVLQKLLDACPESRGELPTEEHGQLRRQWYEGLARTYEQRVLFARLADEGGVEPFRDTRRPEQLRDDSIRYVSSAAERPARRAMAARERESKNARMQAVAEPMNAVLYPDHSSV